MWLSCRRWRAERDKLFSSLRKDDIQVQRDRIGVAKLLGTRKAIPHLIVFLQDMDIRYYLEEKERWRRWEEERDREGED